MQRELPARDMSLPDRVAVLERSLDRERNKRKLLKEIVFEMIELKSLRFTPKGREALLELNED
jgi:hypothetical protein